MQVMEKNKSSTERDLLIIALSSLNFLSAEEKLLVYNSTDTLEMLSKMSISDFESIIQRHISQKWNGDTVLKRTLISRKILSSFNIKYATMFSEEYPENLRNIPDLPFVLFYRGNISILNNKCVSVIGTRAVTPDGKQAAFDFGKNAANDGWTVVGGLSEGVEYFAHLGALKAESGKTVALLPCGIDTIVPSANKMLAASIIKKGCIVSEYQPGVPVGHWSYAQRNRLLAGVASDVVLVQAPTGSGSLTTANLTEEYNRELYIMKTAFSPKAIEVNGIKKNMMSKKDNKKEDEKKKKKMKNICNFVLDDGIPVIDDYVDFIKCKDEKPGSRFYDVSEFEQSFAM